MAKAPQAARRLNQPKARIRPHAIKVRPQLKVFSPVKDPLPQPKPPGPGEFEKNVTGEVTAIQKALQDSRANEHKTLSEVVSTDSYAVIVFDDGEQLTSFLTAVGIRDVGAMFIDGREMADKLGISIKESTATKKPVFRPPSKRMVDLTK